MRGRVRTTEDQQGSRTGSRQRFASSAPSARLCSPHHNVDADEPRAGQRRNDGQNREELRDVGTREAGALCRPGRTVEEGEGVEWGREDPALALFGPLRGVAHPHLSGVSCRRRSPSGTTRRRSGGHKIGHTLSRVPQITQESVLRRLSRACLGRRGSQVRILSPRPLFRSVGHIQVTTGAAVVESTDSSRRTSAVTGFRRWPTKSSPFPMYR